MSGQHRLLCLLALFAVSAAGCTDDTTAPGSGPGTAPICDVPTIDSSALIDSFVTLEGVTTSLIVTFASGDEGIRFFEFMGDPERVIRLGSGVFISRTVPGTMVAFTLKGEPDEAEVCDLLSMIKRLAGEFGPLEIFRFDGDISGSRSRPASSGD